MISKPLGDYLGPPFASIKQACSETGLSQSFLRRGCRDGTVPHIRVGSKYFIDVPELLAKLRAGYGCEGGEKNAG